MKKYIILLASFVLLFLLGRVSYAQEDVTPTKEVVSPSKKEFREVNRPEAMKEKREEVKEKIDSKRRELIGKYFERMIRRFEAAIMRLEKLISRIEARLVKLKSSGQDTTGLELQLKAASDKLAQAKKDLDSLKENSDFLSSEDPKTTFSSIKQEVGLVRDEIKGVHQALVQIVTKIKGLRVGTTKDVDPTSVPSPSVTPTL
ncbi:hypothetical protein HY407_02505 [Candidatus Gottesmanbacteria bacterium]|nr:hypothetical protein [Candidatus Gottesmanbacteria bacterium]